MNPWILRLIVIILAVAFVPILVSGTASLVTSAIHSVGDGVFSLFEPFSRSGNARLEGIVKLCLYLVVITLIARFLFGRRGGN